MACCGDVPTLEMLAAVSIMRNHLPDLKIRVVNVVDLMKLQPQTEHPHGLSDTDFDELFTKDKPVIFGFHDSLWPNLRLVIALHSPDAVLETGLRRRLPEKSRHRAAFAAEQSVLRGPVCLGIIAKYGHCSRISA